MISQTVEYALRAVVTIAQQRGQACTSRQIAEITRVPVAYLAKLLQGLVRGGLVTSQRGLHGGFLLARPPEEVTILEVVEQVDPIGRIRRCPLDLPAHSGTLCPLHQKLDQALAALEETFRSTTVADLLATPQTVTPLCDAGAQPVMGLPASHGRPARPK